MQFEPHFKLQLGSFQWLWAVGLVRYAVGTSPNRPWTYPWKNDMSRDIGMDLSLDRFVYKLTGKFNADCSCHHPRTLTGVPLRKLTCLQMFQGR